MVFIVISLIIAVVVLIHYEFLHQISRYLPKMHMMHRFRIVIGVFGALIAHSVEVVLFAMAYFLIQYIPGWGELQGNYDGSMFDSIYFSATTYTTLGFGDIEPHGYIRHLVGLESLTGLLLITWSASYLFFEMQRYWDDEEPDG